MQAPPRSSSIAPRPATTATISATGAPLLWVALRPTGVEPPYDALRGHRRSGRGRSLDRGGQTILSTRADAGDGARAIDAFVAEHHVERPFHKRKRDRADPEALARRGPMQKDTR